MTAPASTDGPRRPRPDVQRPVVLGVPLPGRPCAAAHQSGRSAARPAAPAQRAREQTARRAPVPIYGGQLQDRAINGVPAEGRIRDHPHRGAGTFGDGTPYSSRRRPMTIVDPAFGPLAAESQISPRIAPR